MNYFIKFTILLLVTKEIIPLNEEYLLLVSFMVFVYLFYKILTAFFYDLFREKNLYVEYAFIFVYDEQVKSINFGRRIHSKAMRIKKALGTKIKETEFQWLRGHNYFPYIPKLSLTMPLVWVGEKYYRPVVTNEVILWFLFEETNASQNFYLVNLDRLFDM